MKKKILIATALTTVIAASTALGAYAATKFTIKVNGAVANTDAKVINGVTYLPLKDIGTLLGASVQYDASSKTVNVTSKASSGTSTGSNKTPTQPTSTIGLSRSKPAPLGSEVNYKVDKYSGKYTIALTLEEVIRGDEAWRLILQENQFNDPAPEGYEYMLAKIGAKVVSNQDTDTSVRISYFDFTLVSSQGKDYDRHSVVTPDELNSNLYVGASDSGYVAFIVKKDDQNPLITFDREYDGSGGVWMKP
ncbi:stalk domain-containing protein [Paenibacillus sp. OV219]|uniref:stalk domain-containing protein n=1 Tax=Paenibacillus sp. OV219 TaxID=1884377 RepID=UPI0008C96459|nr:stalk domain-containing protein [Paenibacillus sp. OV219]SEO40965.1 Copper amine oxidase N-terminal domain-containing protein [Paenibacillus sp. OV219]